MSEIEIRGASIVDVSYPKRTVTVIVAPYETPAVIERRGRAWTEIVSRGAFDGVQRRANRIRANRDHDWRRLAGKVVALYPDRQEGLVADVKMFTRDAGPETLDLCAEDGLSASMGFELMRANGSHGPAKPGAEVWEQRGTVRRLNELWLDHVAFVPDPAYEDAAVLDVRQTKEFADFYVGDGDAMATPNLDRLELDKLVAAKAALDARWGVV
jgi:phage head maturation protease